MLNRFNFFLDGHLWIEIEGNNLRLFGFDKLAFGISQQEILLILSQSILLFLLLRILSHFLLIGLLVPNFHSELYYFLSSHFEQGPHTHAVNIT